MIDQIEADPQILDAAFTLFKERGYHAVEMAEIAALAGVALPAVQTHFVDKKALLQALLEHENPRNDIQQAFIALKTDSAEDMVRDAIHKLLTIFEQHTRFVDLAIIDAQVNKGAFIEKLSNHLAGDAAVFINRLSNMPATRPVSTIMVGRAFAALVLGFIITQKLAPESARYSMRIFPPKAWVDGMADIFLHGILQE